VPTAVSSVPQLSVWLRQTVALENADEARLDSALLVFPICPEGGNMLPDEYENHGV
jgi:hypothetical protein